jgi:hypothetical protein
MPTKVFVSGSLSISQLPLVAQSYLDRFMEAGVIFLIGDAAGVDSLVQEYLYDNHYNKVVVYTSGKAPRNFHGSVQWQIIPLDIDEGKYSERDYHKQKDIRMSYDCTRGFAIWNGKSRATKQNIYRLRNMGKVCTVYRTDFKEKYKES